MIITSTNHVIDLDKLNNDSIIIDAGACVGQFIKDIGEHLPDCKIIAIEPSKSNCKELGKIKNIELWDKTILVGKTENFTREFIELENAEQSNMFNLYGGAVKDRYLVDKMEIGWLINRYKKIDYLKLDVEGAEEDIINSLKPKYKIKQISCEVHKNCDINKLKIKLDELGYTTQIYSHSELYATK